MPEYGTIDALGDEFVARLRRGERPSAEEYATAHPELADEIRSIFPVLETIEIASQGFDEMEEQPQFPGIEVLDELGSGGMGKVFRARETSLDRIVAVKTIRAHLLTEEGRSFFEREAKAAAALDHPGIIRIHSFHPDHAPPYYIMQYVEGQSLDEGCEGRDVRFKAGVFSKTARALAFAHKRGVVHRDIKPANILIDGAGDPHIADFGLAKRLDLLVGQTDGDLSSFKGTPKFIAPEVYEDPSASGPAADIYALGVSLYKVLCGKMPFSSTTLEATREAVLKGAATLPQEVDPDVPDALQRIVLKAMEREPEDRYESATAMAEDLDRFLDGREVHARPKRYLEELQGRLREHVVDINRWHEAKLLELGERDRLVRAYRRMLDDDSPWRELSRRFPWETVLLRLGGWFVLISSILWPWLYWDQLSAVSRVSAIGIPTLLLNLMGWVQHLRRSRTNAVIFLSIGALLLPLFVIVFLSECEWLTLLQSDERELFDSQASSNEWFTPTNFRLLVALSVFAGYCAGLLLRVRARVFAVFGGASVYLVYGSVLLLTGAKEWVDDDNVTTLVALVVPLTLAFIPIARLVRDRAQGSWSPLLYLFFPVPFAIVLTLLAYYFGAEIVDGGRASSSDWEKKHVQHLLMLNAPLYLTAAVLSARARFHEVRHWGPMFMALVPLSLLTPCNVLFEESPYLFLLGDSGIQGDSEPWYAFGFTIYEALAAALSIAFVALGTRAQKVTLTVPGMLGIAIFVGRATDRHFKDVIEWPLVLAAFGVAAMAAGFGITAYRSRRPGG